MSRKPQWMRNCEPGGTCRNVDCPRASPAPRMRSGIRGARRLRHFERRRPLYTPRSSWAGKLMPTLAVARGGLLGPDCGHARSRWSRAGAVAHLVERCIRIAEVVGSIPIRSIGPLADRVRCRASVEVTGIQSRHAHRQMVARSSRGHFVVLRASRLIPGYRWPATDGIGTLTA